MHDAFVQVLQHFVRRLIHRDSTVTSLHLLVPARPLKFSSYSVWPWAFDADMALLHADGVELSFDEAVLHATKHLLSCTGGQGACRLAAVTQTVGRND